MSEEVYRNPKRGNITADAYVAGLTKERLVNLVKTLKRSRGLDHDLRQKLEGKLAVLRHENNKLRKANERFKMFAQLRSAYLKVLSCPVDKGEKSDETV
jgi:hypothetical protein